MYTSRLFDYSCQTDFSPLKIQRSIFLSLIPRTTSFPPPLYTVWRNYPLDPDNPPSRALSSLKYYFRPTEEINLWNFRGIARHRGNNYLNLRDEYKRQLCPEWNTAGEQYERERLYPHSPLFPIEPARESVNIRLTNNVSRWKEQARQF